MYFVDEKRVYLVCPKKLKKTDILKMVYNPKKVNPRTRERMLLTIKEAVEDTIKNHGGNFVWTKTGALLGRKSMQPTARVNHIWENVFKFAGEDRLSMMTVGMLVKLVIAERAENWITNKVPTGHKDPLTQEEIYAHQYFISSTFIPPTSKATKVSVQNLATAWGATYA